MFETDRLIEFAALGTYLVVLLGIGLRSARQVKSSVEYTLAGRQIPWIVVLATTGATMVGGGASIGMVSRVYEIGIAAAFITAGWHLQLIFTGLWIAPKLRGLNLITVGDYFELKFGELARILAVINCAIFLVGGLAAQMAAMATITNALLDIDYRWGLVVGAAVVIFYSTIGGIRAVVKTDVLQFVILVGGIGTAAFLLVEKNGGLAVVMERIGEAHFSMTSHWSTMRVVSLFIAFLFGEMLVPTYAVRCFIAKDPQSAKWGVAGAGLFLLIFLPIATFVMGASAQFDPDVQQAVLESGGQVQLAYPTLVRVTFHPVFAGVMIAALVAAAMSSADSCLSCFATMVMEDIYRRHIRPDASDHQLLNVAKWTTLSVGVAATACAFLYKNIAAILEFVYNFWAPVMILPFIVGTFYYKRERIYAVVAAMIAGLIATIVWAFVLHEPWDLSPALFGMMVSLVVFLIALPTTGKLPLGPWFQPLDHVEDLA